MAFQNEEDYLDNLLKSMSDSNSVSAGSDLLSGNIVIKNNQVAQPGNISVTYIDDDDVAILG